MPSMLSARFTTSKALKTASSFCRPLRFPNLYVTNEEPANWQLNNVIKRDMHWQDEDDCSMQKAGTFYWMAPELIIAGKCTEKADIFSFGIVLHEIVTAEQPVRGRMKQAQ